MSSENPIVDDKRVLVTPIAEDDLEAASTGFELIVNFDIEDILESRTYLIAVEPIDELDVRTMINTEQDFSPSLERTQKVISLMAFFDDANLKVLAKRNRETGLVSYRVFVTGASLRALLYQGEDVSSEDYRGIVEQLEETLLAPGLIEDPLVVGPDGWASYEQKMRNFLSNKTASTESEPTNSQ